MGFVKTPEEIRHIREALTAIHFRSGQLIVVEFMSDMDFVRAVLPPGLEPVGEPRMRCGLSSFKAASCGPYQGSSVHIRARHGDIEGSYVLAMYMAVDNAVLFGREVFGEPKKVATVDFAFEGERKRGSVERAGTRLIEIDMEAGPEAEPTDRSGIDFNYKTFMAADGRGLAADPILVAVQIDSKVHRMLPGKGTLRFDGNVHDPLHEIPVREMLSVTYLELDVRASARDLATVPADAFLPYAYGRLPDWGVLAAMEAE